MLRADQCRVDRSRERGLGRWGLAVGAVLCAGLVGGLVSPAWAAAPPDGEAGDVQLGSFALGDALEATIGELDGAFGFTVAAGGLRLAWDSRAAATDAVRLGGGWSFGLTTLKVTGGVWVYPPTGGAYPMSATSPSGLEGYPGSDVRFARAEAGAVVPARVDGSVGETSYAYVLHELGGASTYFDAAGFPVAKLVVGGDRLDWRWQAGGSGQLLAAVSPDGSVTSLDWSDPSRLVIVPGSNVTAPVEGSGVGGRWLVELDGGRVSAVSGPGGGSTRVGYDGAGLVERVSTPSGGSTVVEWQASTDGVARVDRVRLVDEVTGAELSVREWGVHGGAVPSGWPFVDASVAVGGAALAVAAPGAPGYEAWLSDGKTRVDSTVDAQRRLTERAVAVTATSGERVVQEQAFEYPEPDASAGAPVAGSKPVAATTVFHDGQGASRSAGESYVFDEFGRMTSRVDRVRNDAGQLDATRTAYEYDLRERLIRSSVHESDAPDSRVVQRTEYVPTVGGDLAAETVITNPDTAEQVSTTRRFEYSEVGELLAIETDGDRRAQQFDADGNLTVSGVGAAYEYDAANRPIVQTTIDGVQIGTRYWADGSRRERTTETGSTRFYWDGATLLNDVHETTDGEGGTASYLIGTSRQARITDTGDGPAVTSYYGTDRHGNVTELLDQDGAIRTWYAYSDYGVPTITGAQSTPLPGGVGELGYNPFQYAAEYTYRDGTQPLGPRTYDPVQARFLTEDAAPLANLYAYGDLNPITNIDPSGRQSEVDTFRLGAVAVGFAMAFVGALAFLASGGFALGALGIVTGVVAGGDAVLAGFEVAHALGKVQWVDKEAVEIASWTFAAVSAALFIGAGVTKIAQSVGKRLDAETLIRRIEGRSIDLQKIGVTELDNAVKAVNDLKFQTHLATVTLTLDAHVGRVLKRFMTLRTNYTNLPDPGNDAARAANYDTFVQKLADIDANLVMYAKDVQKHLTKAQARLSKIDPQGHHAIHAGTVRTALEQADEVLGVKKAVVDIPADAHTDYHVPSADSTPPATRHVSGVGDGKPAPLKRDSSSGEDGGDYTGGW
ncbi:RHS repeat domain-containing protein [Agromyces silvae]|uniref:RHS repeat domain-containing protein n=1 Tax=Agromyces silvae TaxID=3388266 RepID=UPI00280AFCFB|nr:RHS repeat-associated core domain-containing protein [Agromyces protaetiae]